MDLTRHALPSNTTASTVNRYPAKAYVLCGPKEFRMVEGLLALPGPDELQVAIQAVGLCGHDIHYFENYWNQGERPMTLGLECAGTVSHVGSNATGFSVGDTVALETETPCGECTKCDEDRHDLCQNVVFRGGDLPTLEYQGAFHEKVNILAARCYRIPRSSLELVTLLKPLTIAMEALDRADIRRYSSILILGAGTIGLLCGAVCKTKFAKNVIIADIRDDRVQFACQHEYASQSITVPIFEGQGVGDRLRFAKKVAGDAMELSRSTYRGEFTDAFDVVLECSGSELSTQTAIYACRPRGKVIFVSMNNPTRAVPIAAAAQQRVEIIALNPTQNYGPAIKLLTKRSLALDDLVTQRYSGWESMPAALDMASRINDNEGSLVLKVVVNLDSIPETNQPGRSA
ncbi:MAG: hypothetical protein Q9216_006484 [Gyalolechia sp. 2 TL-2023]